ncbi:MAG: saccharopine dehydrogenase NADP-binding domain-containing protein, partial [Ignavibacteria bacterium]|nr:saccharopine dehydrogenase NADP-binding domain-containing protein [Ignavibacteria bacterium]
IAGRNESKARELAGKLNAEWRTVDINKEDSILAAFENVNIVINCFSGPFTNSPLQLAELCAKHGIHYLDVAGSYEFAERVLTLNEIAKKNKSTLITALGANPGLPGIALMSAKKDFDEMDSGRIVFVLGAGFKGISVSSLQELKYMFDVKPLVWDKTQWITPKVVSSKEYVGKPFEQKVYLGVSLTRDILVIPELTGLKELSFWSGSQSTIQGLALILGLKYGFAKNEKRAKMFLKLLMKLGQKNATGDTLLSITINGKKNGEKKKRIIEIYCEENYATAIAPALVCQQIVEKKITEHGAFVAPQVVPSIDFMERLKKYPVNYSVKDEKN